MMPKRTENRKPKPDPAWGEAPTAGEAVTDAGHEDEPQTTDIPPDSAVAAKLHAVEMQVAVIAENQLTLKGQPRMEADSSQRLDALELQLAAIKENQRALIAAQRSSGTNESSRMQSDESSRREAADPCGPRKPPSCCIEVFISGLQFLKNNDGNMEIIVAIQAGDTWAVLPSLDSYVLLDKNVSTIIPFHSIIARLCVECGTCKEIPLLANVLEVVQKGGGLEGRPESGTAKGSISVSCACPDAKTFLAVPFAKKEGKEPRGVVGVQVSTRFYPGGCC
jgi:hypothetical protein